MSMRVNPFAIVAALTGAVGLGAGACGSSASPTYGDVMLTVAVPSGVQVKSADYTMDDKIDTPTHGTVSGSEPQTQFLQLIPHVPVSDEYVVTVHAMSAEGQMTCMGSAPVKVKADVKTPVQVALKCGGHVTVGISVTCEDTPLIDFLVSAQEAPVGTFVLARATAAQPDAGALTYTWSASSGAFSDQSASQVKFTCTQVGAAQISLKVQDDENCVQSYSATVTCLKAAVDGGAL